jgi:membrane dipeptidase
MECYLKGWKMRKNPGHIDLEKLEKGQALAQMFAIFIPTHEGAEKHGINETPYEYFNSVYDMYIKEMEENKDTILPAYCYDDIMRNKDAGKISSVLTIEDGVAIDDRIDRVEEFYNKGVRIIALTWNYENCLGYPNSSRWLKMRKGLKPFGIEALKKMNELGIIADVSHLSEGGFWDVAKHSTKPFVATHSCARALCGHPRNLNDKQLKTLGEKGGVVGVNFCSNFLKDYSKHTQISDIVEHAVYISKKSGIEAVALGSDFDGIGCTLEFSNYAGMPSIADAMTKYFTDDQIDKICSGNALRVIKDCMK